MNIRLPFFASLFLLPTLFSTTGCELDILEDECPATLEISGTIDEVDVGTDINYLYNATWFNTSLEQEALNEAEKTVMTAIGLNINDADDIARFSYFIKAFELRLIFIEPHIGDLTDDDPDSVDSANIRKDYSAYIFDLEENEYQPGTEIEVFDFSQLSQVDIDIDWAGVRNTLEDLAGDVKDGITSLLSKTEARQGLTNADEVANTFRTLVDQMRNNGKPDAIIGFNLDRSKDITADLMLINLFSPNTIFANSGTVTVTDAKNTEGQNISAINYGPVAGIDRISFNIAAEFTGHGSVESEAKCFKLDISSNDE